MTESASHLAKRIKLEFPLRISFLAVDSPAVMAATEVSLLVLGVSSRILVLSLETYMPTITGADPTVSLLAITTLLENMDLAVLHSLLPSAIRLAVKNQRKNTSQINVELPAAIPFQATNKQS